MARLRMLEPPNLADADLHMNQYDSVKFLNDNLAEFDGHMAAAEQSETDAYTAAGDMTAQTPDLDAHVIQTSTVTQSLAQDNFAAGAGVVAAGEPARTALTNDIATVVTSVNQPLTNLQQDTPSNTAPTQSQAEAQAAQQAWHSGPGGAPNIAEQIQENQARETGAAAATTP